MDVHHLGRRPERTEDSNAARGPFREAAFGAWRAICGRHLSVLELMLHVVAVLRAGEGKHVGRTSLRCDDAPVFRVEGVCSFSCVRGVVPS